MNTAIHAYGAAAISTRAKAGLACGSPSGAQRFSSKRRRAPRPEAKAAEARRLQRKPDSTSLRETVRLAQQGDAAAFETLYELHSRRVYALCLRMLGDPVEAEDLAQEAFLQLFRKIHTFRGESAFSSWLHRLTANVVLMSFRRKKAVTTSLDEMTRVNEDSEMPRFEIASMDLRLSGVFDRIDLQAAIERLPEGYKAMFILHDVHGYEHNEIAKIFGCSIGNSKSQVHKARKRLRELLHRVRRYRVRRCAPVASASFAMAGGL
jgi:RNA polymerase sigma-70 factor, ECF subfamily